MYVANAKINNVRRVSHWLWKQNDSGQSSLIAETGLPLGVCDTMQLTRKHLEEALSTTTVKRVERGNKSKHAVNSIERACNIFAKSFGATVYLISIISMLKTARLYVPVLTPQYVIETYWSVTIVGTGFHIAYKCCFCCQLCVTRFKWEGKEMMPIANCIEKSLHIG